MTNEMNGTFKIFTWIGGFVAFLLTLYTVFHQPLVKAIANETDCRIVNDKAIEEKINIAILEQKVTMAEIRSDIKYLVKKVDRNDRPN